MHIAKPILFTAQQGDNGVHCMLCVGRIKSCTNTMNLLGVSYRLNFSKESPHPCWSSNNYKVISSQISRLISQPKSSHFTQGFATDIVIITIISIVVVVHSKYRSFIEFLNWMPNIFLRFYCFILNIWLPQWLSSFQCFYLSFHVLYI